MDYGRYFRFDADASDLRNGIAVFCYRPDGERDCPVYATISGSGMEFHMVGAETKGSVLYLPLDENLKHDLTATLADNHTRILQVPEKMEYVKTMVSRGDKHGYFAAFFNPKKRKAGAFDHWALWTDGTKDDFPLAKLVLDFIFDLRETRVFEMSPYHGRLIEKLRGNYFFHALASKAEYLYQRKQHAVVFAANSKTVPGRDRKQRLNVRNFFGELFVEAEREWTACVQDPRSDAAFANGNGWFADSETEMRRVYSPRTVVRLNAEREKAKRENDRLVSRWLVARYSGFTAWRFFIGGHGAFFGRHLFWPRLFFGIGTAWLTLVYINKIIPLKPDKITHNLGALIVLFLILIFTASAIVVNKMAPLSKGVLWKALKLTGLVALIAFIVGRFFINIVNIEGINETDRQFLWIWSAFTGLVIQFFLQGTNPSESI